MNYIETIINKYTKIQTIFTKILSLIEPFDISNIDIIRVYINTLVDMFIEIDKCIEFREYKSFSEKYNFTWLTSETSFYIKTIQINNLEELNDNIITGLYLINSNNINQKILIQNFNSENQYYHTNIPIRFDKMFISDLGKINPDSPFNLYGDAIFYMFLTIHSFNYFANSNDIYSIHKVKLFNSLLNHFIDHFNRYLEKIKKYYELHLIRHK